MFKIITKQIISILVQTSHRYNTAFCSLDIHQELQKVYLYQMTFVYSSNLDVNLNWMHKYP